MRYLKKFNENVTINDIKYFCDIYLIELIDRGCMVRINESRSIHTFQSVYVIDGYTHSFFLFLGVGQDMPKWADVEDIFIPFLEMFIMEYGDISIISLLGSTSNTNYEYTADSLILNNNNMSVNSLVRGIKFCFNIESKTI